MNAKGRVEIGALTLKKAKLTDVVLTLDAPKGKVKTQDLKAKIWRFLAARGFGSGSIKAAVKALEEMSDMEIAQEPS